MPYVVAKNWKGQTLPPGALGYPRSHPNVYSYARPRYFKGRGFAGLGQSNACNIASTPGCTWLDWIWMSDSCQAALDACFYGTNPGGANALSLSPPPSAGPISSDTLASQTIAPTGANVAPDAAAALAAAQARTALANCPTGSYAVNGKCACVPGYVVQSDGTCAAPGTGVPSWVWYAAAAVGAVVLIRLI